jgi:hypothetical protein
MFVFLLHLLYALCNGRQQAEAPHQKHCRDTATISNSPDAQNVMILLPESDCTHDDT